MRNFLLTIPYVFIVYGFYFLFQRIGLKRGARELDEGFAAKISYNPRWVWVYSGIYYPIMCTPCFLTDTKGMLVVWFSGIVLTALQAPFFIFYPIKTPKYWRQSNPKNVSEWVLIKLVQGVDGPSNCFPSMHVSVATLVGLHLCQILGSIWYTPIALFPILIGWSCLKTKQHYVVDLLPAPILGGVAYVISRYVLW